MTTEEENKDITIMEFVKESKGVLLQKAMSL